VRVTVPDEVGLRLARADQELKALQNEVRSYLGKRPYTAGFEADPKHVDRRRIFVRIDEEVPEQVPIRVSECVHHWRAALDNFAYMITRRHNSGHISGSEFPIFLDPVVYAERQTNGDPTRRSGLHKIRGMKPSAQGIIEELQPYNGGQVTDPLWMLHELSNADKHRLLHTCGTVLEGSNYAIRHLEPGVKITKARWIFGPVEDNATVGYLYVTKSGDPDAKMTVDFTLTYRVAFENRTNDAGQPLPTNGQLINTTMFEIRDGVWNACARLRRFAGHTCTTQLDSVSIAP
jgi:hypothetical protein